MQYVIKNGGLDSEADYPYWSWDLPCQHRKEEHRWAGAPLLCQASCFHLSNAIPLCPRCAAHSQRACIVWQGKVGPSRRRRALLLHIT